MVARQFLVNHNSNIFDVVYDADDSLDVFKFQLFSLTSIPPHHLQIIGDDDDRVVLDDSDLVDISNKLKLITINEEQEDSTVVAEQNNEESLRDVQVMGGDDDAVDNADVIDVSNELKESNSAVVQNNAADLLKSDEELARMIQAEEEELMLQEFAESEQSELIEQRLRPHNYQVLMYDDPVRQEAARKTVPREVLEEKALVSLAKEGNFKPSKIEQDNAFLLQLLFWFKQSFRWVNAPPCDSCGIDTFNQGMGAPLPSETQYGATRIELCRCKSCSRITRFPCYNDPLKLVETRRGSCGERANCFTLYCRAFGFDSRLVLDFTDHVWTECFLQFLGRWMHLDPCEGVFDRPLVYEKG